MGFSAPHAREICAGRFAAAFPAIPRTAILKTAQNTNFPRDPTHLKATSCMRPCVLGRHYRTKMFHVKHFGTIFPRNRTIGSRLRSRRALANRQFNPVRWHAFCLLTKSVDFILSLATYDMQAQSRRCYCAGKPQQRFWRMSNGTATRRHCTGFRSQYH